MRIVKESMLHSKHLRMLTFYLFFFFFLFFFALSQTWYLVEILYLSELTSNIEFWAKPLNCPIAQFLCVLNKGVDIMTLNVTSSSSVYTLMTESFLIDADKLECSQERPKIQEWAILNLLILLVFNRNLKSLITSLCAVSRPSIFSRKYIFGCTPQAIGWYAQTISVSVSLDKNIDAYQY